jgi:hypothetical protein
MKTWTASKHIEADPAVVLDLLTDPDACRRWSPVPFDVDDAAGGRLAAGSRRIAEQATAALLHAGALGLTVDRIGASAAS